MPLYEYRCLDCGRTVEVIQKFSDAPLDVCQTCGGNLERVLSAPAIQFKGSGWYVTDYARNGGRNGSSKKETPSETKSDTTSAAKPAADAGKPKAD